jgi:putative transport protein
MDWFVATLRQYPEIALFLSLGIGYWVGGKSFKGFSLGAVTATLLAAIALGQLGIKVSPDLKATFFLLFLFAIGYGVGPQFIRGITKDGLPQAIYAVIVCLFCLGAAVGVAKIAGYDAGAAAGLFAGSQTISASMGLATDAINRLALGPDQTKSLLDIMPTAYAITYIFGTVGSAIVIAIFGPILLRIDLKKSRQRIRRNTRRKACAGGPWRRMARVRRAGIQDRTRRQSRRQNRQRNRGYAHRSDRSFGESHVRSQYPPR